MLFSSTRCVHKLTFKVAALEVFTEIGKIADTEFLATDVLPILWNFSLGPLLNLQQFQSYMALIKSLSSRIEQDHTRKLQEMSASNPAVASRNDFMSFGNTGQRTNGLGDGDTSDFEALVLGKKGLGSPGADSFDIWQKPEQIASNQLPVRTSTSRQNSPAPTFSWSTPSPSTTVPPPMNTQPMSSFGVLQPQSSSTIPSSFAQPLQPTIGRMNSSTNNPPKPSINWSAASSTSAWSSNPPSLSSSNAWASSSQPQIAPASSYGQPVRPGSTTQSSFTIAPPPKSPYSNFGIAPPPAMNLPKPGSMNSMAGVQPTQPQQQTKKGLDQWESLL